MEERMNNRIIPGSFRDPSGFLFQQNGDVFRQVNIAYKKNYDHLMNSGLYGALVDAELLIPHKEINIDCPYPDKAYKITRPERILFISYPYEWCFSQLKSAALATLEIQRKSLDYGMLLKDSSAYNMQFMKGKPILIDTLSFEEYREEQPWVAYRQFCQHFLAPLALMSHRDIRLNQLLRIYIDGIPLDLSSAILPTRTRFMFSLLSHIHLHAKSQKHFADKTVGTGGQKMSRNALLALIDNLKSAIVKLHWKPKGTEWGDYYKDTNYSDDAILHKKQLVAAFLDKTDPKIVWDLGANVGIFSRIASNKGIQTIAFDIDPAVVEKNYLECLEKRETNILPLLLDLTNPSPSIGWENRERMSIIERGPCDTALALALIHHLAISNNLSFLKIADFFKKICNSLIIEFVPKNDSQVQRMLSTREDIFSEYTQQNFENAFERFFIIDKFIKIKDSDRSLYLMERRQT